MKIAGRNIKNLRYADDTTLDVRKQIGAKEPFLRVKKESEKARLMLNIQKMKITPSVPSLHRRRGKMETMTDFIFLDSKITEDGNCSHEIKRCLLLGRKAMTNLAH